MRYFVTLWVLLIPLVAGWCQIARFSGSSTVVSVDFTSSGAYIVAGYSNGRATVFDANTLLRVFERKRNGRNVKSVSSNGGVIGISFDDDQLDLYNDTPPFGSIRSISLGHNNAIISIDSTGTYAVSCGNDKKLKYWTISSGTKNWEKIYGSDNELWCKFAHSSTNVAYSVDSSNLYLLDSARTQYYTSGTTANYKEFDWRPDETAIIGSSYGTKIWKKLISGGLTTQTTLMDISGVTFGPVCYSPTSNFFAAAGSDKAAYIFNGATDDLIAKITIALDTVKTCRFSKNGNFLILGDNTNGLQLLGQSCPRSECESYEYKTATQECRLCALALPGCGICSSASTCLSCLSGYYLNSGSCSTCHVNDCLHCSSSSACTFCAPGYIAVSGSCSTCASYLRGCLVCSSSTVCAQCQNDFYKTASNTCATCTTITNCIRCTDSSTCISCAAGYYVNGGNTCQACSGNCVRCYSSSACSECTREFFLDVGTGSCTACSSNCAHCSGLTSCLNCLTGYYLNAGSCSACVSPCVTCNSAAVCLNCEAGYGLTAASACARCPTNCTACSTSTTCDSCQVGYFNQAGGCVLCQEVYPNCLNCLSGACQRCQNNYYLSAITTCSLCTSVLSNCERCSSSAACGKCVDGYYIDGSSQCSACSLGCLNCTSSSACTSCVQGFYYNAGACSRCPGRCIQCSSNTVCSECASGYYLDGSNACSTCVSNNPNCLSCTSATVCSSCISGYFLNSGAWTCDACASTCATCSSAAATGCLSCPSTFYLSGTNTCNACPVGCSECTSPTVCQTCSYGYYQPASTTICTQCALSGCEACTATTCSTCLNGYYLTGSFGCSKCASLTYGCLTCTSSVCTSCKGGYLLATNGLSCLTCSSQIMGCHSCQSTSICNTCQFQYYKTTANICTACPSNCTSCVSATVCTACHQSFLFQSGTCRYCPEINDGCEECSAVGTCSQCQLGYYLSSPICRQCHQTIQGCVLCSSGTSCSQCIDTHRVATSGLCEPCSSISIGCVQCSNALCLSCQSGFSLSTGGACLPCQNTLQACAICLDSTHCQKCEQTHYLATNGLCRTCSSAMQGCISCSSISACYQCDSGYYLTTGTFQCQPCGQTACSRCAQSAPTQCESCRFGYYLSGTNCLPCQYSITGCLGCSDSSTCIKCAFGYYQNSGSCTLCSTSMIACMSCTSPSFCTHCSTSYYLGSANQCSSCQSALQGCYLCSDSLTCKACGFGYYLNSAATCSACSSMTGCISCSSGTTCDVCKNGYVLQANQCFNCNGLQNCFACSSPTVCVVCQSGFKLDKATSKCAKLSVEASKPVLNLRLKTAYVDKSTLKHMLLSRNTPFTPSSRAKDIQLALEGPSGDKISLTIKSYSFPSSSEAEILTDNPLSLTAKQLSMTSRLLQESIQPHLLLTEGLTSSRLLQSSLIYATVVNIAPEVYAQMLPTIDASGPLTLNYNLNEDSFKSSFIYQVPNKIFYSFGLALVFIVLLNHTIKVFWTAPSDTDKGQSLAHILAIRFCFIAGSNFSQYINTFAGMLSIDLPWLNSQTGRLMGDSFDAMPALLESYYVNLNIGSTYFVGLCILCLMFIIFFAYYQTDQKVNIIMETRRKSSFQFLFNLFGMGLTFYGGLSIQGASLNPILAMNANSVMYILGIMVWAACLCYCLYRFVEKGYRTQNLRILIKGTLISVGLRSPIAVFIVVPCVDIILAVGEYHLMKTERKRLIVWLSGQVIVNLAMAILVLAPQCLLSLSISLALVVASIIIDIYLHIKAAQEEELKKIPTSDEEVTFEKVKFTARDKLGTARQTEGTTRTAAQKTENTSQSSFYQTRRQRNRHPNIDVIKTNIEEMPYEEDNNFDLAG